MNIQFVYDKEEKETNIGIAKALTESIPDHASLHEIAEYLLVYCKARSNEMLAYPYGYEMKNGGGEE